MDKGCGRVEAVGLMVYVPLEYADMALFTDIANTRVPFPRLSAEPWTQTEDETVVAFYGDKRPTPFRGEGETVVYPITVHYFPDEQQLLADMLALFKFAHEVSPDPRLLFRSNVASIADLNPLEVVTVATWTPTPAGAGHFDLTFMANAVEFTVEA